MYTAGGKQQAGYQHPACGQDQCTAPPALAVEAVRDQLGRGGADGHRLHCLCTALFFSGRESLPQSLGVGSTWAGSVHVLCSTALGRHSEASPVLPPANLVTELVTPWGL